MALTESVSTHKVEVVYVDGVPTNVYRQLMRVVLRDGVGSTPDYPREVCSMGSDEAKAIFGDVLADTLAQIQALTSQAGMDAATIYALQGQVAALTAELDGSRAQVAALTVELDGSRARIVELEAQLPVVP